MIESAAMHPEDDADKLIYSADGDIPGMVHCILDAIECVKRDIEAGLRRGRVPEKIDEIIEEFVKALSVHFCYQHREALGSGTELCAVNPYRIVRERCGLPGAVEKNMRLIQLFIENFQDLVIQMMPIAKKILEDLLKGKNVVIISNHLTFANIPIIIALLYRASGQKEDFLDSVWTILGPALMTQRRERDLVMSISNTLLTQPPSERGKVKGFPMQQGQCALSFRRELLKLLKHRGERGRVIVMAPSGTRDRVERNDEGVVEKIRMRVPSRGAQKLFDGLENLSILPIFTNELDVYSDRIPERSSIDLAIGEMSDISSTNLSEQMDKLVSLCGRKDGVNIASLY